MSTFKVAGDYLGELLSPRLLGFVLTHLTMVGLLAPWAWIDALEPVVGSGGGSLEFEKVRVYLSLWTTTLDEFTDEEDKNIWQTIRIVIPIALVLNIVEYLAINVILKSQFVTGFHHGFLAFINAIAAVLLALAIILYAATVDKMFEHLHTYDEATFGTLNDGLEKMYYLAGPVAIILSICTCLLLKGYHFYSWWNSDL
jgi:hypothetical protein